MVPKIRLILLFLLLLFVSQQLQSQFTQWHATHYSIESGLPSNQMLNAVQDSMGYIWFASSNGLVRFDGINFKVYQNNISDSGSVIDNYFNQIMIDSKGRLLAATPSGVCVYNPLKDNFSFVQATKNVPVSCMIEDRLGNIWLGSQVKGLLILSNNFELKKQLKSNTNSKEGLVSNYILSIFEDKNGTVWIETEEREIYSYNLKLNELHKYNQFPKNIVHCINESFSGNIIFCTGKGLYFYNIKTKKFTHDIKDIGAKNNQDTKLLTADIRNCIKCPDGKLWICHSSGFSVYDTTNGKIFDSDTSKLFGDKLFNIPSQSLFFDKQGNLWVTTINDGLYLFSKTYKNFKSICKNEVKNHLVTSITLDNDNNIWIGTYMGTIIEVNQKTNFVRDITGNNSAKYGTVFSIYAKPNSKLILIGTFNGFFIYNKATIEIKQYIHNTNDPKSISSNDVRDIVEDKKGRIWIATNGGGINLFNEKDGTFSSIQKNNAHPDSGIVNNYSLKLLFDSKNNLWISTYNGFTKFDISKNRFYNYNNELYKSKIITHQWVYSILEDSKNNIWLGTANGLNKFSPENNQFKYYYKQDGLSDNLINGLVSDKYGNIWISTGKGITKYIIEKDQFKSYETDYDLPINEFSRGACGKTKNGEIFFGGNKGIILFNPDDIKNNPYAPNVIINDFKLFNTSIKVDQGDSILKQNISYTHNLTLKYDQNVITFGYVALNFINPLKNQYAYRLIGFDKNWQYVGNKNEVTYTNLSPGTYIFRVKASNDDGVWNYTPTEIILKITPPFWQKWWFIVICTISIIFILIAFNAYRLNSLQKRNKELEKLVNMRTGEIQNKNNELESQTVILNETNSILKERQQYIEEQAEEIKEQRDKLQELNATKDKFFSLIAHDLKSPFNVLLGFVELLYANYTKYDDDKRIHFIKNINESSQKIFNLLINLLDWSLAQRGLLEFNPEEINAENFIRQNIELLKSVAHKKNIGLNFKLNDNIKNFVGDRNLLSTVLRNLISNAIKYTPSGGSILIICGNKEKDVVFEFLDTGIGIPPEDTQKLFQIETHFSKPGTGKETGTGLGLILCKEFVEKHGGKIGVESEVMKGSRFWFSIPADIPNIGNN